MVQVGPSAPTWWYKLVQVIQWWPLGGRLVDVCAIWWILNRLVVLLRTYYEVSLGDHLVATWWISGPLGGHLVITWRPLGWFLGHLVVTWWSKLAQVIQLGGPSWYK